MSMNSLSRRDWLRRLAVGAGAVPALARLRGTDLLPNAHAASTGAPRRLVLIDVPLGLNSWENEWLAVNEDNFLGADQWDRRSIPLSDPMMKFGPMLAPFEDLRNDMTVINFLKYDFLAYENMPGSTHSVGAVCSLTGSPFVQRPNGEGTSRRPSIDVYLANAIGKQVTPAYPSMYLGVYPTTSTSFALDGTELDANPNPYDVYTKMFSRLNDPSAKSDPKLVRLLRRRKSVLDHVTSDLTSFRARLGAEDRARADAQLDAIRTLEKRLAAPIASSSICHAPGAAASASLTGGYDSTQVPALADAMNDIITSAFACDMTRIVNVQNYGGDPHETTVQFAPVTTKANYEVVRAHYNSGDPAVKDYPEAQKQQGHPSYHTISHHDYLPELELFIAAKAFFYGKAADLARKLKAIPEASGTMLDNTLIVCYAELGMGHSWDSHHYVTLGGKNLGVKNGQFIKGGAPYTQSDDPNQRSNNQLSHNMLLVSILNAMGMADETYGDPGYGGRGPLPGFFKV